METAKKSNVVLHRNLVEYLEYDPESGELRWLKREPKHFAHCRDPERACSAWNGRNAGKTTTDPHLGSHHLSAAQIAWLLHYGTTPRFVTFADGNRQNLRIDNLRAADRSSTHAKLSAANTSGVKGVSRNKRGYWVAQIGVQGKNLHLGSYGDKTSAIEARKSAERKYGYGSPEHHD
jgi:hypothetical protein